LSDVNYIHNSWRYEKQIVNDSALKWHQKYWPEISRPRVFPSKNFKMYFSRRLSCSYTRMRARARTHTRTHTHTPTHSRGGLKSLNTAGVTNREIPISTMMHARTHARTRNFYAVHLGCRRYCNFQALYLRMYLLK